MIAGDAASKTDDEIRKELYEIIPELVMKNGLPVMGLYASPSPMSSV